MLIFILKVPVNLFPQSQEIIFKTFLFHSVMSQKDLYYEAPLTTAIFLLCTMYSYLDIEYVKSKLDEFKLFCKNSLI